MKIATYFHCGGLKLYPKQRPGFPKDSKRKRGE
jgi:hypothetical protein